jgi:hypothetical protein
VELTFRTSQPPMPMTLAPGLTRAMSLAAASVFSTLRPRMQALAPRRTSALVCMLHIVPAPPVTNTTRPSNKTESAIDAGTQVRGDTDTGAGCGNDRLTEDSVPPHGTKVLALRDRHSAGWSLWWSVAFNLIGVSSTWNSRCLEESLCSGDGRINEEVSNQAAVRSN